MKNNIIKNTSMLYLMNIAKMIFPLLTLPYLTRVLTVDCYGTVSYIKAVMQYMQLIVDFGFVLSGTRDIVNSRNDIEQLNIEIGNVLAGKLLLSSIAFIILWLMTAFITILRKNISYTYLSFASVFLTNFLFDYLFRGLEKMEVITIRFVIMKGITAIMTFFLVNNDNDILWIPGLEIIGSLVAIALIVYEIKKLDLKPKVTDFLIVVKKIKDSAIYFFSNMATTAFMALNTLLIGLFCDTTQVAYWSLCLQMVTAAQSLYTPLTDGIYPYMVKTRNLELIKKAAKIYMPLVSLGCVFTLLISKYALLIVGGSQYIGAANVLRSLVPVLFFSFLSMLFGWPVLGAIRKQREATITTVVTAIVQITGLFLLLFIGKFNLITIALLRGITEALLFLLRFRYVCKFKNEFA